jgi:molybdate transport system substrate-binding protein
VRRSLLVLALVSACGSASTGGTSSAPTSPALPRLSGTITVFAAASLTKTFTALGKDFETAHPGTTVRFSFGPSSGLATQILAGAPADLFASASAKNMKQVTDAGDASGEQAFASNVAEIAAAPGSSISSLADLAKPGVKVALCEPKVPCGALAVKVLGNVKVTVKPVTLGLDVKSTLAYVTNGSADAAIVYVTDVLAAGDTVKGIEIPAAVNASTAYEIAPITAGKNSALAQAFEDFVLSGAGQAALRAAGFQKP